jgi:hypothetical protein
MANMKYMIKLVWKQWKDDVDRDKRMGFDKKYKKLDFNGAKMLIYLTGDQVIKGINTVTGTFEDGKVFSVWERHTAVLPVTLDYEAEIGLNIFEIRRILPHFDPKEGDSFYKISKEQFYKLESMLRDKPMRIHQ